MLFKPEELGTSISLTGSSFTPVGKVFRRVGETILGRVRGWGNYSKGKWLFQIVLT